MDIDKEIQDRIKSIKKLKNELDSLIQKKTDSFKTIVLNQYVKVDGLKGWNKGIVSNVHIYLNAYSDSVPDARITIKHAGSEKTTYGIEKVHLMTPEEIAQYNKSLEIDKRINDRVKV